MRSRISVLANLGIAAGLLATAHPAGAQEPSEPLVLLADTDDDDDDGTPDGLSAKVVGAGVHWLTTGAARSVAVQGTGVRVVAADTVLATSGERRRLASPRSQLGLQGLEAGRDRVVLDERALQIVVLQVVALDWRGQRVDLSTSHASLSRVLPEPLGGGPPGGEEALDRDALRWLVMGPTPLLPPTLDLVTVRANGEQLDRLTGVRLKPTPCGDAQGSIPDVSCVGTEPIRATVDEVDRDHPSARRRSVMAEVGGRIRVEIGEKLTTSLRVGGPRETVLGGIGRLRARVRVRIVRMTPGGAVPFGMNAKEALRIMRREVTAAGAVWGQCGIHFGPEQDLDIAVVDPPGPELLAIGCGLAMPAGGGRISFAAGAREVRVEVEAGQTPTQVAAAIDQALARAGLVGILSANARVAMSPLRSVDILVRSPNGSRVKLRPLAGTPLSTDPSLGACLVHDDLGWGLEHFTDFDAAAGTPAERTLIKAFDDHDPATLDVIVVPSFAQTGRIGESFIDADRSSVQNTVIVDSAGIRARVRSNALAHELGHILLNLPGHPDDYGVDQPGLLMDADASEPTIFGPRRLPVEDCVRVLRESGPGSPTPILEPWPLYGARASARQRLREAHR